MTPVDLFTIRVHFVRGPGAPPSEEWTLSVEPEDLEIDEQGFDAALVDLVHQAGQGTTFHRSRTFRAGGWGATGLTVLEVLVTLGMGAASNAMYDALVALYRRFARRTPIGARKKVRRSPGGSGSSAGKRTRKAAGAMRKK